MTPEFVNMYIETLLNEISEAAKSRLLIQTQLKYTEKLNIELANKIIDLESKLEKQTKKINKKIGVDTPDTF